MSEFAEQNPIVTVEWEYHGASWVTQLWSKCESILCTVEDIGVVSPPL